ncbi:helix-hairpin-helix domain-containing protein [Aquimarina sp. TRL1]|uniref:helix-hairpin-helix domain-containing protein n=1 Tax=Aquimarina sp. (strain TRL1) TaxID=2736252 RepID=UPI001588779B|nr:helix-hairpin-helix domain-containing protein [Aquimarina sp. TRL1]QKX05640.1 helix-hairpin-helix domain-containing protein [Aquimarina sp. TRL1]
MKNIKSHFEMHERFRNGIFLLLVILFLGGLAFFFYPVEEKEYHLTELENYQKEIDSLKLEEEIKRQERKKVSFNPNFISDYKGYILGMSVEELDRLHAYRKKGLWITSAKDFQKVTQVSDSLLNAMTPLFLFPEWSVKSRNLRTVSTHRIKKDLNSVSAEELIGTCKIPDFIAERIIKYRDKLQGFLADEQLEEVYGLYKWQRENILKLYTVKQKKTVQKINVNKATVEELLTVPYFDFETAIQIREFIEENKSISELGELRGIEGFDRFKINRIALYLYAD